MRVIITPDRRAGRKRVVAAPAKESAAGGVPGVAWPAWRRSPLARLLSASFDLVNRFVPWHVLPRYLGAVNLLAFREELREENLHDTSELPASETTGQPGNVPPASPELLWRRTSDGSYNDLRRPAMGAAHARFGRNVPLLDAYPEPEPQLLEPSPRLVSNRLLARQKFIPAETLNLLAGAWIQFMTHDWFNHGTPMKGNELRVPVEAGDGWPEKPMLIRRTPPDPTRTAGSDAPPTYVNQGSHWWDASQIYGNTEEETFNLRCTDEEGPGKLRLARRGRPPGVRGDGEERARKEKATQEEKEREEELEEGLPIDARTRLEHSGVVDNWWTGLSLLHTLFAKEHNAIIEQLRLEYPGWSGDRLFHTARLINAALMAKVHTVEWTTAILGHPTLDIAMNGNWWGLATERISRALGRLSESDLVSGIPGSPANHHAAPFALTEEFVAVYRLHPLIPDGVQFHRVRDGVATHYASMAEIAADRALSPFDRDLTRSDALYSFGIAHPGAPILHNYPDFLRGLERVDKDGQGREIGRDRIDLASIDVMRDRERGIPRYNRFRELLHRPRVSSFEELTSNQTWARELRDVYGHVDRVDTMVGMYAEDLPQGFGFSDTAFRVFILMASRRLKSDRFFTTDYNANVYSQLGLDWVAKNNMRSVLLRHYPRLAPVLRQVKNAFAPWPRVEQVLANGGVVR